MKSIETQLGAMVVISASMERAGGYGQYKIIVELETLGTIAKHSTDSQLFDTLTDLENNAERSDYLINNAAHVIELMVQDYADSL